jgi:hypothetical protein
MEIQQGGNWSVGGKKNEIFPVLSFGPAGYNVENVGPYVYGNVRYTYTDV